MLIDSHWKNYFHNIFVANLVFKEIKIQVWYSRLLLSSDLIPLIRCFAPCIWKLKVIKLQILVTIICLSLDTKKSVLNTRKPGFSFDTFYWSGVISERPFVSFNGKCTWWRHNWKLIAQYILTLWKFCLDLSNFFHQ